ncbi:MAG: hypothetical protein ACR2H2_07555 [Solirubrobacteraceae bacterium]
MVIAAGTFRGGRLIRDDPSPDPHIETARQRDSSSRRARRSGLG